MYFCSVILYSPLSCLILLIELSLCFLMESPLESKIKSINLKRNQPWVLFGRTDSEAPTLWPPDVNSWLIGKDPDAEIDWRQKEKKPTEDEMVGWHHQFNGHRLGQTLGDGEGQGSLESQEVTESDTTWWLNKNFFWWVWLKFLFYHFYLFKDPALGFIDLSSSSSSFFNLSFIYALLFLSPTNLGFCFFFLELLSV